MSQHDLLQARFPELGARLPRTALAALPTPVRAASLDLAACRRRIYIKDDAFTGEAYGGNKVRKLEYLFGRIDRARFKRVATYGTVASNHALATAVYTCRIGLAPICFLAHQSRTPLAAAALARHLELGTELVPYRGDRAARVALQRRILQGRGAAVIPLGGSSWAGCVGFITAGLELGRQVDTDQLPRPDRVYIATGTMGTAAGLALGLALAGLPTEVHAVRVSDARITHLPALKRLMKKCCAMLHRLDANFPVDLHRLTRVHLREEFFGPGYARPTPETDAAIALASDQLGLRLEPTYTGKAFAALLED
ncbi:MAG: pyridoxal-phosphate dependent enzyme, partial [Pseudomonadota bacterium]